MRIGLRRIVEPATALVTSAQVCSQSHIDSDTAAADADLITQYIQVATDHCEQDCGRSFITQTWRYSLPRFDHQTWVPQWVGATIPFYFDLAPGKRAVYLPRPPLQSVTSVEYYDETGTLQTLDPSQYAVDTYGMMGSIRPVNNWPQTQQWNPAAVVITYVAGYGDTPNTVPSVAVQAVLLTVALLYEYREPILSGSIISSLPMGIREWLDTIRVVEA
jgi:uncharacterized phiE125 gp8 family phage protein